MRRSNRSFISVEDWSEKATVAVRAADSSVAMSAEVSGAEPPARVEALKLSISLVDSMSANLSESSKKLDGILAKGDSAVDSAKKTMETVDKAAADLRTAMSDFKRVSQNANNTLDSAKSMMDTGNRVLKKAEKGEGALGMLLSDRETAENLKAFASNLRRSGPVFYKDRQAKPTPAPRRR